MNAVYLKKLGFELVGEYDNLYSTSSKNFRTRYTLTLLNEKKKNIILQSTRGTSYSGLVKNRKDFESLLKIMGYEQ